MSRAGIGAGIPEVEDVRSHAQPLYGVADRLSQGEGAWRPFDRSGWRRRVYG